MTFSQKGFDREKVVEDAKILSLNLSLNFFKTKLRGFAILYINGLQIRRVDWVEEDKIWLLEKVWGIVACFYMWLAACSGAVLAVSFLSSLWSGLTQGYATKAVALGIPIKEYLSLNLIKKKVTHAHK